MAEPMEDLRWWMANSPPEHGGRFEAVMDRLLYFDSFCPVVPVLVIVARFADSAVTLWNLHVLGLEAFSELEANALIVTIAGVDPLLLVPFQMGTTALLVLFCLSNRRICRWIALLGLLSFPLALTWFT